MKTMIKFFSLFFIAVNLHFTGLAQVLKVDAVGITVSDLDNSVNFYTDVLGFKKVSETEVQGDEYEKLQGLFGIRMRIARLQLGDEFIELTDYLTSGGRSIPGDFKSNDLAFQHIAIVVSDMEKAYAQLRKFNIEHVSSGPQTLPASIPEAAGIKAFYFHDPDKHKLELIFFPTGKGQSKWQQAKGKLFLGIDHTAIGVSNTNNSVKFYQDMLGIERKGDSWNKGNEQAHLNFIENASLHITGLRAAAGPGIEFLEYIIPGPGRAYPADSKTDDIWHWQTILITDDATKIYQQLRSGGYTIISKELVQVKDKNEKLHKSFIVRDADGHALLIREQ
ncbi:MAG: VOC family protein [Chitinophagaceae bacterium]|nr:VOC family protein [Chitinophagaceae bacterium]